MAFQDASNGPTTEARAPRGVASPDFIRQLTGYGLTTAQILYRMPDHPALLQTYLWQHYDLSPHFPELNRFLEFWARELEGPLHSVTVAHSQLIKPAELRRVDGVFRLN
ncbi:usg protein [Ancylobacter pratisalsi]|uniref:Usg family protein n=1 Tax=Ancylobacter pratisalsi TaxID=1745854 RepID=A0A6P1YTZ0_9HYPH|nr:usg protein [Ancylobacter pratisalsi]QIB35543.1 Usg family protein [Ancylobacter pratisalsi]